jgi:hypothetical protein
LVLKVAFNIMGITVDNAVPPALRPGDVKPSDNSDLAATSEGMRHDQAFDGIDWSKAAPSWASIFTGLVLPLLALALLVVSIDLAFGWLFERWVGSSSMSPVLLAAIMFLPALLSAFCCCKLFLYLKER